MPANFSQFMVQPLDPRVYASSGSQNSSDSPIDQALKQQQLANSQQALLNAQQQLKNEQTAGKAADLELEQNQGLVEAGKEASKATLDALASDKGFTVDPSMFEKMSPEDRQSFGNLIPTRKFNANVYEGSLLDHGLFQQAYKFHYENEQQQAASLALHAKESQAELQAHFQGFELLQSGDTHSAMKMMNMYAGKGEKVTGLKLLGKDKVWMATEQNPAGEVIDVMAFGRALTSAKDQLDNLNTLAEVKAKIAADRPTAASITGAALEKLVERQQLMATGKYTKDQLDSVLPLTKVETALITKATGGDPTVQKQLTSVMSHVLKGIPLSQEELNFLDTYQKMNKSPLDELIGDRIAEAAKKKGTTTLTEGRILEGTPKGQALKANIDAYKKYYPERTEGEILQTLKDNNDLISKYQKEHPDRSEAQIIGAMAKAGVLK